MQKILKNISNNDKRYKALKNSLKEFETLYKTNHPCVCIAIGINIMEPVTDTDIESESGDDITIVALFFEFLEYCLFYCIKIMNNTPITKIVVEIAHAMNSIHKHRFIHRDLIIENIRLKQKSLISDWLESMNVCSMNIHFLKNLWQDMLEPSITCNQKC